jgi:hypothetical protein
MRWPYAPINGGLVAKAGAPGLKADDVYLRARASSHLTAASEAARLTFQRRAG